MNTSKDTKFLSALALILAIALAPVSTAAFAQDDTASSDDPSVSTADTATDAQVGDTNDDQSTEADTSSEGTDDVATSNLRDEMKKRMEELRELRVAKIQEFKDKVKDEFKDRVRTDLRPDGGPYDWPVDRHPDLTFSGEANGWTVVGSYAWKSTTTLHGEAWHIRGDVWKVHSKGTLIVADRSVDVELKGFSKGHRLTLHGNGYLGDDPIRVFIRGHYAPTVDYGVFGIAFNQMAVHNENTGAKFVMAQVGTVKVTPTGDVAIPEPLPYDTAVDLFQ